MSKNLLIGGALIGGGLYFAYKKGLLDKFLNKKPAETTEETPKEGAIDLSQKTLDNIAKEQKAVVVEKKKQVVSQAILNAAQTAYKRKVEELQSLLKVGIDGKPGNSANSQTNKAIAATYGLDKGIVNPTNVQYYIDKAKNKQTLVLKVTSKKKVEQAKNQIVKDAKAFLDLVKNQGLKARLTDNVVANKFQADKAKGVFVQIQGSRGFKRGQNFKSNDFTSQTRGAFVLITDGKFVYPVDPSKFIVN